MAKLSTTLVLTMAALLLAAPAIAANTDDVASLTRGPQGLYFENLAANDGGTLTVTGPGGFLSRQELGSAASAGFDISGDMADGLYSFELTLRPKVDGITRRAMSQARATGDSAAADRLAAELSLPVVAGYFTVSGGAIVSDRLSEAAGSAIDQASGASSLSNVSAADILHLDDVIISGGSLCVGFDCVNGESFGFDTYRAKENNLRFHFDDTSNSASFPSNDWRIVANDTSNGGASYLSFEDSTAGNTPFRVLAGAGNNALYVDAQGDVGLNTSNPVVELHIADGDTPTLRLEQNGSSGFTPQTWDVAGNETNFFVRDITNGSQLPFRIQPGAKTNSLYIENTDDVGIGTSSPDAALHVNRSGTNNDVLLRLTNNMNLNIALDTGDADLWQIRRGGSGLAIDTSTLTSNNLFFDSGQVRLGAGTTGSESFLLETNGNLAIAGNLTANGIVTASDVNLKESFAPIDGQEILNKLVNLPVTTWAFKSAPNVRHIGPMAQDFRSAFGFGEVETHINLTDIGGLSIAAIQELYRQLEEKQATMETLKDQNNQLMQRLEALEARLIQ